MARSNNIFTRIEKKYVLNEEQYQAILPALHEQMVLDIFGKSRIEQTASRFGVKNFARLPIKHEFAELSDAGKIFDAEVPEIAELFDKIK